MQNALLEYRAGKVANGKASEAKSDGSEEEEGGMTEAQGWMLIVLVFAVALQIEHTLEKILKQLYVLGRKSFFRGN